MTFLKRVQKIYSEQDRILSAFKKLKSFPFVLSGGTALSRFYFHHRVSVDLDFFCKALGFSFETIEGIVNHLIKKEKFTCELVGKTDRPGRLKVVAYNIGQKIEVKVDFLEDPFSGMWKPQQRKSNTGIVLPVDHLDQIYYRKFYSIIEQKHRIGQIYRAKDLVDLYFLHRRYRTIEKTIAYYDKNHVPMNVEKLTMSFCQIKKRDFQDIHKLKIMSKEFDLKKAVECFNLAGENLLKKALGKK